MRAWLLRSVAVALAATLAAGACDDGGGGEITQARRGDDPPEVSSVEAPDDASRFHRFEATATIDPEPENPFDPTEIDVQAVFRDPDGGEHRAIGFFYQGYERELVDGAERLSEDGEPVWKVRFAPPAAGSWEWRLVVRTPGGTTETEPRHLDVDESDDPGFLRPSSNDPRYLAFDDGSPYFAIGENVGWYDDRGAYAYDDWYAALEEQGVNYSRLWMPSWAFGLEWSETGLGDYGERLDRAWQLDRVIEAGEEHGIYAVLSLLNHGAFSTVFNSEWADNPYNAANGGPLASPAEFFTNPTAKELFKQRLRYIVARWGYSTHLLSWELWNEIDLTDGYDSAAVTAWHAEMAAELRRLDPARHLVTTSFALPGNDRAVWSGAGLDYTQLHAYARASVGETLIELFTDVAGHVSELTSARLGETDVPVLFAELGVDARGPGETMESDPEGIGVHDGLWAGALSGGLGTAMTWWWDNLVDVEPERYYPMFGSIARFVEGIEWDRQGFLVKGQPLSSPSRPLVSLGLQGTDVTLVWIKDPAYQWHTPERVEVADATITFDSLAPFRWCGQWWDTWEAQPLGEFELDASSPMTIEVPEFSGDIAARLERC